MSGEFNFLPIWYRYMFQQIPEVQKDYHRAWWYLNQIFTNAGCGGSQVRYVDMVVCCFHAKNNSWIMMLPVYLNKHACATATGMPIANGLFLFSSPLSVSWHNDALFGELQDLHILQKYLVSFTVGLRQKKIVDAAVKKVSEGANLNC